jgi:hypothetical protein
MIDTQQQYINLNIRGEREHIHTYQVIIYNMYYIALLNILFNLTKGKTKSVNNRKTVKTVMTLTWYRHF